MDRKLLRSFSIKIFKCHLTMLLVSFIFTFFFADFLSLDRPVVGYIYSGLIVLGYGFLLYSENVIEARKNFYNVNGVREKIDIYLGFKCGILGHILTFILFFATTIFYLLFISFDITILPDSTPLYLYFNLIFRFWELPFLNFFPSNDNVAFLTYFIIAIFPSLVSGPSYIRGLYQCKTIKEIEDKQK